MIEHDDHDTVDNDVASRRLLRELQQSLGVERRRPELAAELPWWMDVLRFNYDDQRERGVAIVLLGWDIEMACVFDAPGRNVFGEDQTWPDFSNRRPYSCPVPPALRYAFMWSKAMAFCDGYYCALRQNGSDLVRMLERGIISGLPDYNAVKWRILDGDGFDDENIEGGDYILAARIALSLTATHTRGLREENYIPVPIIHGQEV